jgi:predicted transcriptional regulator of viral defense system
MTNIEIIQQITEEKGYITSKMIKEKNISSWFLTDMVKKGMLKRIGRGVYVSDKGVYDEYFDFQYRNSKAIYSFSNALYFHGLTDQIPSHLEVTVYQGYNAHRFEQNVIVHYVKKDIHQLGAIELISPSGNPIRVYDKERSLCDLVSSRQIVESEVFKKAFQSYFRNSDKDVNKLMSYATKLGIETEMFTLIEVLT